MFCVETRCLGFGAPARRLCSVVHLSGVPDVQLAVQPTRSRVRSRSGNPAREEGPNVTERPAGKECGDPPWPRASPARRGTGRGPACESVVASPIQRMGRRRRQSSVVRCPVECKARYDGGQGTPAPDAWRGNGASVANRVAAARSSRYGGRAGRPYPGARSRSRELAASVQSAKSRSALWAGGPG